VSGGRYLGWGKMSGRGLTMAKRAPVERLGSFQPTVSDRMSGL